MLLFGITLNWDPHRALSVQKAVSGCRVRKKFNPGAIEHLINMELEDKEKFHLSLE
jgi:hypothetical protein